MQRVTVTLEEELTEAIDFLVLKQGYQNRSEAVRDLVRTGLQQARQEGLEGQCVATLTYVYDHESRELSKRLVHVFHEHHDVALASLHVHLDHESCLETAVLRGSKKEVQRLADHIIAERGVRYGRLVTIPVIESKERHTHEEGHARHSHITVSKA